jgi:aspartate-semialdehyde dehydrogenase
MDNDDLILTAYAQAREKLAEARERVERLEQQILAIIDERHATGIPSSKYNCQLQVVNSYSPEVLVSLKEVLSAEELADCYTPEHPETVTVPEKWSVTKLLPIARQHGDSVMAVLARARVPSRRSIKFEVRD